MVTAVIFDFDGVLADSEAIAVAVEMECLAAEGLTYDHDAYVARFCGLHERDFIAALEADAAARLECGLGQDFVAAMKAKIRRRMDTELVAMAGAPELLARLDAPRAVASSSTADALARKMHRTGLTPYFAPHVYSGDLVARAKPAPDLFLHAAAALGHPPARCVAIEDSVNGVRAGVAAGMAVIGFTGGTHCAPGHGERLKAAGCSAIATDHAMLQRSLRDLLAG